MEKIPMTQEDREYFKNGVRTLCGTEVLCTTAVAITAIICITLIILTVINNKKDKDGKENKQ